MVGSLGSREELDEEKLEAFVWSLDQARITRWASAVGKKATNLPRHPLSARQFRPIFSFQPHDHKVRCSTKSISQTKKLRQ